MGRSEEEEEKLEGKGKWGNEVGGVRLISSHCFYMEEDYGVMKGRGFDLTSGSPMSSNKWA